MTSPDSIHQQPRAHRARHGHLLALAGVLGGFVLVTLASGTAMPAIPVAERQALLDLHERTRGGLWSVRTGWLGAAGTECDWHGVRCDAERRHVIGLNLANNQLRGQLPRLDDLKKLRTLNVALNRLEGPLPPLYALAELRELAAHDNLLRGPLPELRHLDRLERVRLANNRIDGTLPALSGLAELREFDVSNNLLRGVVPALAGLDSLRRFDASFNQLRLARGQASCTTTVDLEGNASAL
ncbi:MAG: hypothetical protein QM772_04350 [Ottowia sp.]|uniref:leucine-rich repeat domain-containing protein n=1 Tax=Ottowia sp. TaxID=1898956 RepID=UPI0039E60BDB